MGEIPVQISLTGVLRYKAEKDKITASVKQGESFADLLACIGRQNAGLQLLEDDRLLDGLLLFYMQGTGGLERIMDLGNMVTEEKSDLFLTTSMAGG